ncbi:MAG TPA: Clp protease N-terminal domain-containing protein, partial [Acidimicrobiales bacterium]|nr:Clp protease N-terminal domain-containing protein [Acidimicrobiales bacterium]
MDPTKLTQKSSQALQDAQSAAVRYGHSEVDGEHLLLSLLEKPDDLVSRLLQRAGADTAALRSAVEGELARRPRVSGPGAAPGEVRVTQRLSRLLDRAEAEAKRLKDEYVSVEHLLLALLEEGSQSAGGRLLRERGITRDSFLQALTAVR